MKAMKETMVILKQQITEKNKVITSMKESLEEEKL